nr:hypothetical protein [Campylobacter lari]
QLKNNKNDPFKKYNFQKGSYEDVQSEDIKQYASIGSDRDWFFFAKSWNEDDTFKLVDKGVAEYRLIGDVDFKGSQGQNYANYCIDGLGCTSMIVNYFTGNKTFNGQGYKLYNINIDVTDTPKQAVGLFGVIRNAIFKNINVDYEKSGGIKAAFNKDIFGYVGAFTGRSIDSKFENIKVSRVGNFEVYDAKDVFTIRFAVGGFVGSDENSNFYNIALDDFSNINVYNSSKQYVGGFAGELTNNASLKNISLNDFGIIIAENNVGGFVGEVARDGIYKFENIRIDINGIDSDYSYIGGFAGSLGGKTTISNVSINLNSGKLIGKYYAGGFAGYIYPDDMDISSIYIHNIDKIHTGETNNGYVYAGGFAGQIDGDVIIKNIILDNIKEISADKGNAGGFAGSVNNDDYEKVHSSCFSNISINGIKKISSGQGSAGGFIGFIGTARGGINFDFNNIALNFKEGIIQGKNGAASFIGRIDNQSNYDDSKYHDTK